MTQTIVVNELLLQLHTPSEKEVEDYARYIGLNTELDRDLFWIAEAGLRAPVPAPWRACQKVNSTDLFYYNFETGQSVWEHPSDCVYKDLAAKTLEQRVTLAITLTAQTTAQGLEVLATNLVGRVLAQLQAPADSLFGDLCTQVTDKLDLPKGTVPRFLLQDARVMGHSASSTALSELFL